MSLHPAITTTPEIDQLLARNAVVAIGVSGGKDSDACAIATSEYLDMIGHTGPRLLVHADLGSVEWVQSLSKCEALANTLGWELQVVSRKAGGMMDRWRVRWANNVSRYQDLSCVKLILPWSTPTMRFCTSELKSAPIASYLRRRFKGQDIVNVTGIRREESTNRRKAAVAADDFRLKRKNAEGMVWNSIIDMELADVKATLARRGVPLHEAYTVYGSSRVSCTFCIMQSEVDMQASVRCEDNHANYRDMVDLEVRSTFAFQSKKWLGDVAPHLLGSELADRLALAKEAARVREIAELRIPASLTYHKGWPVRRPTLDEAKLLVEVRTIVSDAVGLGARYLDPLSVIERYDELLALKMEKAPAEAIRLPGDFQLSFSL